MYYLIYLSSGTQWFAEDELREILAISNINNFRDKITGMLLYGGGNFIQLLEGEEQDVKAAYERISLDERHKGLTPIASGQIAERNFPLWAMGFKPIGQAGLASLEGFLDPANEHFLNDKPDHISITLLKAFVRTAKLTG